MCSQLPHGAQLVHPPSMLHEQGPGLLQSHLRPTEGKQELEQRVVPATEEAVWCNDSEGERERGREGGREREGEREGGREGGRVGGLVHMWQ